MTPILALFLQAVAAAPAATAAAAPVVVVGWDPVTITLIGGQIVLILTTIGGVIISIITHLRVSNVKDQQTAATATIGTMAKDTEAIKGSVNGEKTASTGRELALRNENTLLREMLADKKTTAQLLAQAIATSAAARSPRATDPTAAATAAAAARTETIAKSLDSIDTNTAAIAENTATTAGNERDQK